MKPYFRFLTVLLALALGSCATIINHPLTVVNIETSTPATVFFKNDTFVTKENRTVIYPERSKKPASFRVKTDSLEKVIWLKRRYSSWFFWNIYFNYGLGMIADARSPKKYDYPRYVFVDTRDTVSRYFHFHKQSRKNYWMLHLALPYANSFYLQPRNEGIRVNTGFWGITAGLEYFYDHRKSVMLEASTMADFFLPVPAPVDYLGEYEVMSSAHLALSHRWYVRRFGFGSGLVFAKNTWSLQHGIPDDEPPTREPVSKTHFAMGSQASAYFQVKRNFDVGLVYRPTFWRPELAEPWGYEHVLSLDLRWRIARKRFNY